MKPIFKEQIQMWKDLGFDIPIEEGTYWFDNNFIKAFTPDGELHKLYKYKVKDDLSIQITKCNSGDSKIKPCFDLSFETWEETVQRNSERLSYLETESLNLIKKVLNDYSDYEKYMGNKKPLYLCYLLVSCEMGSDGWSGWSYYCVAKGNTPTEVVYNWLENVKLIYGVDLSKDLRINEDTGFISVYYPFCMHELKESVYGHSEEISINFKYMEHES